MSAPRVRASVGQALGLAAGALAVSSMLVLVALGLGPRTGAYRTLTVLTGSMRPSIPEGSVVIQTAISVSEVRKGDVITYRIPVDDHRVVTHRVVEVVERGANPVVRTKGDANRAADPWVARLDGDRLWRVRATIPGAGHVLEVLRRAEVRQVTVTLVPLLLAATWLREIWGPRRRPAWRA